MANSMRVGHLLVAGVDTTFVVWATMARNGLAVHPGVSGRKTWSVTHVRSGKAVRNGLGATEARRIFKALLDTDWTFDESKVTKEHAAMVSAAVRDADKPRERKPREKKAATGVAVSVGARPLCDVAAEIVRTWHPVNYGAVPYLRAMSTLYSIQNAYGCDDGASIVRYFLSNANSWRGDVARRIKAELHGMLKAA